MQRLARALEYQGQEIAAYHESGTCGWHFPAHQTAVQQDRWDTQHGCNRRRTPSWAPGTWEPAPHQAQERAPDPEHANGDTTHVQTGNDEQMRCARGAEALLDFRREVATLADDHGEKDCIIRGGQHRPHASTQALAPLFKRAIEAEALRPMPQAQALWITHPTRHINALPAHEALEVKATRVV